jgi:hypothetical protein
MVGAVKDKERLAWARPNQIHNILSDRLLTIIEIWATKGRASAYFKSLLIGAY